MAASQFDASGAMAQAIKHHAESRLAEAEACYKQIVGVHADHADAWNGLALVALQQGRLQDALAHATTAAGHRPEIWRFHQTRGLIATALGDMAEAARAFQQATSLNPSSQDAWCGLAESLQASGRLDGALAAFRHAQKLGSLSAHAANNFGVALNAANLPQEAASVLRQGLTLAPERSELWYNLGNALSAQSASAEALDAYRQSLRIDSNNVRALLNLGNVLRTRHELGAAIECYEKALEIDAHSHDGYNNLGATLWAAGRPDDALAALRRAIELRPESSTAHNNLGNVLKDTARVDAAINAFRRAVQLAPQDPQPHSNLLYSLYFHPDYDEAAILEEAKQWARAHAAVPAGRRAVRNRQAGRLNIGYVSPDFRNHCQSLFTLPLLSHHDRQAFKIHCYAQLPAPDTVSRRIEALADVWRPIQGMSDAEAAAVIVSDEIDILVDLTMHMSNARTLLFARKAAPVQVAWLAYPGTTGQTAIDYRLTDPWLDPMEAGDDRYVERSIRLPNTFWCYDPGDASPPLNELPALKSGYVTFGCLNNFCKVTDASLRSWGRVMAGTRDSRLILLAPPGKHLERVLDILREFGIASSRVEFVPYRPRESYLATYHRIDICLDTLPYNGHTTSLDAYWMGVPVITRLGHTVVGRAGWSQLNNLELAELAATDEQALVDKAVQLAGDLDGLSRMRASLRERMRASALMNAPAFTAAIESIFRRIAAPA